MRVGASSTPSEHGSEAATSASAESDTTKAKLAASDAESSDEKLTQEIPTTCSGAEGCVPDPAFAERVCRGKFPNLPFALFAKGTPWQRLYVKAEKIEPVNAYGGPSSEAWMQFGEEVVVLRRRGGGNGSGVQISGPTDVDVLRWDGTCATVRQEMFVTYITGDSVSPRIVWKYLEDPVRESLEKNRAVTAAETIERRDCRSSSPTHPSPACDKAMERLTSAIIIAVRLGAELPTPANVPAWRRSDKTASR